MIHGERILLSLVQGRSPALATCINTRPRGCPRQYSDRLLLKALLIIIVTPTLFGLCLAALSRTGRPHAAQTARLACRKGTLSIPAYLGAPSDRAIRHTAGSDRLQRSLLGGLSQVPAVDSRNFNEALRDPGTGNLAEHIEVLVNDAGLDLTHNSDSPIGTSDRIALIGQYLGG